MYTEENEFNYNDYLDESEKYKRPLIDFKFILKIILIILLILLIIFLVFKIKNRSNDIASKDEDIVEPTIDVFDDNFDLLTNDAHIYYFDYNNVPKGVGDFDSITIKDLIDKKIVSEISDENGNLCSYRTSGANIVKYNSFYKMNVKLNCSGRTKEDVYYYDLDGKCLNCEDRSFIPIDDESSNEEDNNNNDNNNDDNNLPVCTEFSSWTTEYKADSNLERQTRTVVKGSKIETKYGEWSELSETEIIGYNNLEVQVVEKMVPETSKTCSDESTVKPESKEGREITTRTESHSSTKKVCTGGKLYTKTLTKWDNNAISCKSSGIGKVVCTYKTKITCSNKTSYYPTTYYTYCDTVTTNVNKKYYQSRTITKNTLYTDYILESDMPEGYTKVNGSERVEYRYRTKCSK